jgi:hypothetical protein
MFGLREIPHPSPKTSRWWLMSWVSVREIPQASLLFLHTVKEKTGAAGSVSRWRPAFTFIG